LGPRACYILRRRPLITSFLSVRPQRRTLAATAPPVHPRREVPMLPHDATAPQPAAPQPAAGPPVAIGVGIDTARYGHYTAFLRPARQPAAAELAFAEDAGGYEQLRQCLGHIARRYHAVHFHIRLDVAGQYADNLRHFLQRLAADPDAPLSNAAFT